MTDTSNTPAPPLGAVATPHSAATQAAVDALRAGGNALDAALAAAAVLCVVYPNNVALGSDLVALVRLPDGTTQFVNATGTAPAAADVHALGARHGDRLPVRGVDTITVPGAVRGWEALHGLGSALGWERQFDAAIRLAADGVPTASSVANAIAEMAEELADFPGWNDTFVPGGVPLARGALLRQPELAHSMHLLATHGPDEFYTGGLAARWIDGLNRLGARFTHDDAARYRVRIEAPLVREVCGHRVFTSPPNTQGFSLLRVLDALTGSAVDPLRHGAALMADLFEGANTIREHLLADPEFGGADGDALLTCAVPGAPSSSGHASGDTVGISVIDADGRAVSLIQSVYYGFGSGVLEPDTGILFQNRGTSFSLDPASPNAIAPGHRPRHTLMPVLVFSGDAPAYVSSTMGGQGQPQIHAQILLRAFAGDPIAAAVAAPRWVVGDRRGSPTEITYEADLDGAALASLRDSGREMLEVQAHSETLGHANLIRCLPGGEFEAASDPRSDGSAEVVR